MLKPTKGRKIVTIAYIVMLIGSTLPLIIFREIFNFEPSWLLPIQTILFAIIFLSAFFFEKLKKLKLFVFIILLLMSTQWSMNIIQTSPAWNNIFDGISNNFILILVKGQLLRLAAALLIFFVLLVIKKRPKSFFITQGDIDAEVKPIKFILTEPSNWKQFGFNFAIYLSLGTLIFLIVAGGLPSLDKLISIIPIFPFIIIFAMINSFYEELGYRAALISVLEDKIGSKHALYISSLIFGIAHFYGVPYGIIGVLMATFLGYILGKSMIETRGFFWAFVIHMILDIFIFSFMALNMIKPGG